MDALIYCLKCKLKTSSNNVDQVIMKNNRNAKKGTCSICGTKKSQFAKSSTRSSFLNVTIGKPGNLDKELHLAAEKGENVPNGSFNNLQKYSYAGPGTKYLQRNREDYKGIR